MIVNSVEDLSFCESIINKHIDDNVYLHINLRNYINGKIDKKNASVHLFNKDTDNTSIMFQYFNTLHVYCENTLGEDIVEEIKKANPQVIYISQKHEESLHQHDFFNGYDASVYDVYKNQINCSKKIEEIKKVKLEDIDKVANFLMKDPFYASSYASKDELMAQITDRIQNGTSRYYAFWEGQDIVAMEGSNGETDNIAVIGALLVDPSRRRQGYGKKLFFGVRYYLSNIDKKIVYSLTVNDSVIKLMSEVNAECVGKTCKLKKSMG